MLLEPELEDGVWCFKMCVCARVRACVIPCVIPCVLPCV